MQKFVRTSLKGTYLALMLSMGVFFCAESLGAEGSSGSKNFEVHPYLGVLLPDEITGLFNTVKGAGLRGIYFLDFPLGLEASSYFWKDDEDSGKTFDGGIYYEVQRQIKTYMGAGLQYSRFDIKRKYKADGACANKGCKTDSGSHVGLYIGGGWIMPISDTVPVKMGIRFYKGPSYWVLIDIGAGFRF